MNSPCERCGSTAWEPVGDDLEECAGCHGVLRDADDDGQGTDESPDQHVGKPLAYRHESSKTRKYPTPAKTAILEQQLSVTSCRTCHKDFVPKRTDSQYCGSGCRVKAHRGRRVLATTSGLSAGGVGNSTGKTPGAVSWANSMPQQAPEHAGQMMFADSKAV